MLNPRANDDAKMESLTQNMPSGQNDLDLTDLKNDRCKGPTGSRCLYTHKTPIID